MQDTSNHRCKNLREHQAEGIKNAHTYNHYSPNAENQNEVNILKEEEKKKIMHREINIRIIADVSKNRAS